MKRLTNKHSRSIWIFLLIYCMGCDPISDVKLPDHESQLVVNAFLVAGKNIRVDVSKSVGILGEDEPELRLLKDAKVELFEDEQFLQTLSYRDSMPNQYNPDWGLYSAAMLPKALSNYEIRVSHPEYGVAYANTSIPERPMISNIRFEEAAGQTENGAPLAAVFFTLSDPPGIKNYYEIISILRHGEKFRDTIEIRTRVEPWGRYVGNGNFIQDYEQAPGLLSDELFDGKSEEIALFIWVGSGAKENGVPVPIDIIDIAFEVRSCDEHYFQYRSLIDLHLDIQNEEAPLFPAEPIAAYSNVSGGLGIVGSYHAFRDTVYR